MRLQEVDVELGVDDTLVFAQWLVTDSSKVLKIDGSAFLNLCLAPSINLKRTISLEVQSCCRD